VLSPILRTYGSGTKVRIVYNAEDLGEIYVWGPGSDEPVAVPALNQQYARGLTSHQNELIQKDLRAKGLSGHDPRALEESRQQLVQAITNLLGSRKQKDRRRAAKIQGTSSSKATGLQAPSQDSKYDKSKATRHESTYQSKTGIFDDDVLPSASYPLVHSQDLRKESDQ
jgi:putative transposase